MSGTRSKCRRNDRVIIIVMITFFLLVPTSAFQIARSTNAVSQSNSFLELGYGPSSLSPLSSGIPVYSVGDQLWILSQYNQTLVASLTTPEGTNATVARLYPSVPTPLYSFEAKDPEGMWSIGLGSDNGSSRYVVTSIPLQVVNPANHLAQVFLQNSSLVGDKLSLSFGANLAGAYDGEACLSSNSTSYFQLPLPQNLGSGVLSVEESEPNNVTAILDGTASSPFAFWFEIYHPYSYAQTGSNGIVTRDVRVAESAPVFLNHNSSNRMSTTILMNDAAPTVGKDEVRAFFEYNNSLFASETKIIMTGSAHWVWAGTCQFENISSQSFSYLAPLGGNPGTWPRTLYLMYMVNGVESVSSLPIQLNVSKATFVASPWDASLDANILLNSDPQLGQATVVNDSIYVLNSHFPVTLNYQIALGNNTIQNTTTIIRPYGATTILVDTGELLVHVAPSALLSNTAVSVYDSQNRSVSKTLNASGYAMFVIPAGSYIVKTSVQNKVLSSSVVVNTGQYATLDLNYTNSGNSSSQGITVSEIILVGVVGSIANVFFWFIAPNRILNKKK